MRLLPGRSETADDPGRPVERFRPTTGLFVGYAGLAVAAFAVVCVLVAVHTVTGLKVALGALFAAVVIWVSQLRIGKGIPLFAPRHRDVPLRLLGAEQFSDGVVQLHYAVKRDRV